jgi:hypothetical protein
MIFLHGFLAWLTTHCWGLHFGAKWMRRVDPAWANGLFISASFLRFCLIVSVVEAADLVFLIAIAKGGGFPLPVALCLAAGSATGVALGRAAY